jgi:hypothetical protein
MILYILWVKKAQCKYVKIYFATPEVPEFKLKPWKRKGSW